MDDVIYQDGGAAKVNVGPIPIQLRSGGNIMGGLGKTLMITGIATIIIVVLMGAPFVYGFFKIFNNKPLLYTIVAIFGLVMIIKAKNR